jgi:hypothetical protein
LRSRSIKPSQFERVESSAPTANLVPSNTIGAEISSFRRRFSEKTAGTFFVILHITD